MKKDGKIRLSTGSVISVGDGKKSFTRKEKNKRISEFWNKYFKYFDECNKKLSITWNKKCKNKK